MGAIADFFLGSTAKLYGLIVGALVFALAAAALLIWGLYWRGEARDAKAAVAVYAAQIGIDKDALEKANDHTAELKRIGDTAIANMAQLVAAAREAHKRDEALAQALNELARQPRQAGQDCNWAWQQAEDAYQQNRKARPTP